MPIIRIILVLALVGLFVIVDRLGCVAFRKINSRITRILIAFATLFVFFGLIFSMQRSPEWTEEDFKKMRQEYKMQMLRAKYARIKAEERLEVERTVRQVEAREARRNTHD